MDIKLTEKELAQLRENLHVDGEKADPNSVKTALENHGDRAQT